MCTENEVLFRLVPRLNEMVGIDLNFGTPGGVKKSIDKLREEFFVDGLILSFLS